MKLKKKELKSMRAEVKEIFSALHILTERFPEENTDYDLVQGSLRDAAIKARDALNYLNDLIRREPLP